MQTVSSTYKQIIAGNHSVEYKVFINEVEYGADKLYSMRITNNLFSEDRAMVGSCCSSEIDLELIAQTAEIPKMARIEPQARLVNATQESEWLPQGVFFIDTRERNRDKNTLVIHGYDAMLKLEQTFTTQQSGWPKNANAVVAEFFNAIGVTYDGEFTFADFSVPYPGHMDGAYTWREVLGYIAGLNGGNFIIKADGQAHFVQLKALENETFTLLLDNGDRLIMGKHSGVEVGIDVR